MVSRKKHTIGLQNTGVALYQLSYEASLAADIALYNPAYTEAVSMTHYLPPAHFATFCIAYRMRHK